MQDKTGVLQTISKDDAADVKKGGYFPSMFQKKKIQVTKPGSKDMIYLEPNPLYTYVFGDPGNNLNPADGIQDAPVGKKPTIHSKFLRPDTARHPNAKDHDTQNSVVEDNLEGTVANLREQTFLLVASYEKYGPFSN